MRPRLHPERGASPGHRSRRLQLVRLRRAQRVRRVPPLGRERVASTTGARAGSCRARRPSSSRDALAASDDPEAERLVEGDARLVLREDARLDRPDAGGPCARDQRIHERPTDAAIRGRPPRRRRSSRRPRDSTLAPTSGRGRPSPAHARPSVATMRCEVSFPASNSAHVGVTVSKVACRVAMPSA